MKASKKTETKALTKWDEKFAKYAAESQEQVKGLTGGGPQVKFRAGSIEVAGGTVPNNRLECVVMATGLLNAWYKDEYDPDNPVPPDCYALAEKDKNSMKPHPDSPMPQCSSCSECAKNEFGSAPRGRGKACGNKVRLALLLASDLDDAAAASAAEFAMATCSPTNVKAWAGYVSAIADEHGRPPWAVVTAVSSHPDSKTQIRLEFKLASLIEDDELLEVLEKRLGKAQEFTLQPFAPMQAADNKNGKPKAGGSKKFAGKGSRR
jgi:hypothetical protein